VAALVRWRARIVLSGDVIGVTVSQPIGTVSRSAFTVLAFASASPSGLALTPLSLS
jgi:hypothetical protein